MNSTNHAPLSLYRCVCSNLYSTIYTYETNYFKYIGSCYQVFQVSLYYVCTWKNIYLWHHVSPGRPRVHKTKIFAIRLSSILFTLFTKNICQPMLFYLCSCFCFNMLNCIFSFTLTYSPATGYEVVAVNGASGLWELSNVNGTIEQG